LILEGWARRQRGPHFLLPRVASRASVCHVLVCPPEGACSATVGRERVADVAPWVVAGARANRTFLARAITWLARAGVDQFLDIGCGLPTAGNVHEVAQVVNPTARTVYCDNDDIVLAHARALLARDEHTIAVYADAHAPDAILDDLTVRGHLDPDRPMAVLMIAVLHFLTGPDEPTAIVTDLLVVGAGHGEPAPVLEDVQGVVDPGLEGDPLECGDLRAHGLVPGQQHRFEVPEQHHGVALRVGGDDGHEVVEGEPGQRLPPRTLPDELHRVDGIELVSLVPGPPRSQQMALPPTKRVGEQAVQNLAPRVAGHWRRWGYSADRTMIAARTWRTPLTVWFTACWMFASQKDGVSALSLQRTLDIGSYTTAWTRLHRLRSVLIRSGRDRLTGMVEVDETYIGGEEAGQLNTPKATSPPH
jgi:hypothetical protein